MSLRSFPLLLLLLFHCVVYCVYIFILSSKREREREFSDFTVTQYNALLIVLIDIDIN